MDDDLRELRWKVVRRINDLHRRDGLRMPRAVAMALKENGVASLEQLFGPSHPAAGDAPLGHRLEYATQLTLPLLGVDEETLRALPSCSNRTH